MRVWSHRLVVGVVAAAATSAWGQGNFVESSVFVRCQFAPAGGSFGWAVAELADIDSPPDGAMDFILPAPGVNQVYVYSGKTCGLLHLLVPPANVPGNPFFGNAVSDAGDVNDDGTHDIIVGANRAGSGWAFVYSGADGSLIHTLIGEAAGDGFGAAVAGAGDVDGDGHDDVLIGAAQNDAMGGGSGRAYVISGATGLVLRYLEAEAGGNLFGSGIARTGDLDHDGFDDHIVGAPGAGKAYVFSGQTGSLLFSTTADPGASNYGTFFVAGAGDVNNDLTDDVYVGDYGADGGNGKAYVYSGVDGAVLHVFPGNAGDGVGPGRGAGDVDGDGFADLIVGYYTSNDGAAGAGKTVVFSGQTGLPLRTMTSLTAGEALGFDAVGVGDVDDDGKIDFLVSAASQSRVYLVSGATEATCAAAAVPTAAGVAKNRYLSFSAAPPSGAFGDAMRVRFDNLPPPHSVANGRQMWVGQPQLISENPGKVNPAEAPGSGTFWAATLQCEPLFLDWTQFDVVHVYHRGIVSGASYTIQGVNSACPLDNELSFSFPAQVVTSIWGDLVKDCATSPCGGPDGSVDVATDVVALLDKFSAAPGSPIKARADLGPDVPDFIIDISDVLGTLDAFSGGGYPFVGPAPVDPCGP